MLVRRQCLDEIGLFDQRYFAYGDEHDLGARAVRHGWKVVLVWGSIVTNPATRTENSWRSYLFARNSLFLVHAYFGRAAATLESCSDPAQYLAPARLSPLRMAPPFRRVHAGRQCVIILVAAPAARLFREDSYLIARFCAEHRRH
jgi:GT2 family glycosyltransferase